MLGESLRERFGERTEVPIRHAAIKLLASDTRLNILKLLDTRRMTVSEMSRALSLNKSTVHEHLGKLVEGGLIKRDESEEREWVYYELTKTARYVLQPSSARFVLLMATAVFAGIVLVAFAQVLMTSGQGLSLAVADAHAPAGEAALWTVEVSQPGALGFRSPASEARLYMLTPEEAAEFQRTKELPGTARLLGDGQGLAQPQAGRYTFRAALDPGTHYVLARSASGDALAPVRAEAVHVLPQSPTVLMGVDPPQVEVAVQFRGESVTDGFVSAVDTEGREVAQVPVVNGKAVIAVQGAQDKVHFLYKAPEPGSAFAAAEGSVAVPKPHVAFEPSLVALNVPTEVRIVVDDPVVGPRAGAHVALVRASDGRSVSSATTNAEGSGSVSVRLTEPGDIIVKAGEIEVGRITAMPGLRLWVEPGPHREGDRVRVRTLHLGQEPMPVAGTVVLLDGRDVGITDDEGWFTLQFGLGGPYEVQVQRDGYVGASTVLDVLATSSVGLAQGVPRAGFASAAASAPMPAALPTPRLELSRDRLPVGDALQARALLVNTDDLPRLLRADLYVDGRLAQRRVVEAAPLSAVWVAFDVVAERSGVHSVQVNDLPPASYRADVPVMGAAARAVPGPGEPLLLLGLAGAAVLLARRR